MAWYSRPSPRMARQIAADAFVAIWTVFWMGIAKFTYEVVMQVSGAAQGMADKAGDVRFEFDNAASKAGEVPMVGDEIRVPFDKMAASMDGLISGAQAQADSIERLAWLLAFLVVAAPVGIVIALWLPARVRFHRTSSAALRHLDSSADLSLFALRAMAHRPLHELAAISDDPVAAWRAGDSQVVTALAAAQLRADGIRVPRRLLDPKAATHSSSR